MEFVTAKGVIKALVSPVIDLCGIYDALLARRVFSQPTWLILMYHRIIDTPRSDPFRLGMCVDRAHFAEQIEYLTRWFTPLTVEDAINRLRRGQPLPRHTMSVTFDDGYRDLAEFALPVLERYGCPATVYVSTDGIEQNRYFWWDRVIAAFAATRRRRLDIEIGAGNNREESLHLSLSSPRRALLRTLDVLWNQPATRINELVDRIETELGAPEGCLNAARMTLEDVARLDPASVEVAVHCETHADLTLMRPDDVLRDISLSRQRLEDATGRQLPGFAYPGGRENAAVRQLVSRSGFAYAAGTGRGVNRDPVETFNLRRIGMPNTSIADFKRCLNTAAGMETRRRDVSSESIQWP